MAMKRSVLRIDPLGSSAGLARHKEVRFPKPNDFSPIESGDVDVYAHGVHWWMEVPWLHGVTAGKLVETGLKANDGFLNLSKIQTISDEVAKVMADYQGSRPIRLTGLTELSEANAARLRSNEKIVLPSKFQKPEQQ